MSSDEDRLAQLLAIAAAGRLGEQDGRELDAWAARDPAVRAERDSLLAVAARLDDVRGWVEAAPRRRRSPRLLLTAAAVVLVALGAVGALGIQSWVDRPPEGPPGTLGAVEHVDFAADRDPAEVHADVVAHTWGTEAVLVIDGLDSGSRYNVAFLDEQGREIEAGSFLGSDVTIDCRVNAAVPREDVRALVISAADGSVVRTADLPQVRG